MTRRGPEVGLEQAAWGRQRSSDVFVAKRERVVYNLLVMEVLLYVLFMGHVWAMLARSHSWRGSMQAREAGH